MAAGDPILASDYAQIRRGTIDLILCRLEASGTQSLAAGGTAINFSVEAYDPQNIHAAGSPSRITPVVAGYYHFQGAAYFAANTNQDAAWLRKNGTTAIMSGNRLPAPAAGSAIGLMVHATVYMNGTTDFMELMGDPGGTILTNQSAQFSSFLECYYTGRVTNP